MAAGGDRFPHDAAGPGRRILPPAEPHRSGGAHDRSARRGQRGTNLRAPGPGVIGRADTTSLIHDPAETVRARVSARLSLADALARTVYQSGSINGSFSSPLRRL